MGRRASTCTKAGIHVPTTANRDASSDRRGPAYVETGTDSHRGTVESPISKVNVGTACVVAIYPDIGAAHELLFSAELEVTVHLIAPGVHI